MLITLSQFRKICLISNNWFYFGLTCHWLWHHNLYHDYVTIIVFMLSYSLLLWCHSHYCHDNTILNIIISLLWCHDVVIIVMTTSPFSWHLNHCHEIISFVMKMFLMSWQWFWCHDNDSDVMTMILMSWQQWLWHHDKCFAIMTS